MILRTLAGLAVLLAAQDDKSPAALVRKAVAELVKIQEEGGAWPYEGVYRVGGEIPVGYRVGGTSLVAGTLLHAAAESKEARAAVARGLDFVLRTLSHPLLEPSTEDRYDVRVWGHASALEFLCQVRAQKAAGERAKEVDEWIPKLVSTLATEEIEGGGWNYATHRAHAPFVTAPVVQALLWARGQGFRVPDEVLGRARRALEASRADTGAFLYSGVFAEGQTRLTRDQLAGSSARSAVCETTLRLLGGGSPEAVQGAIDAFHKHWDELEKRRKKTGTHVPPYSIAPYYFYYGHRYAGQAIEMLPERARAKERERLLAAILRTRDEDGTWNDRVFPRSRNYGTAMVVLALLADRAPIPPALEK
jgi:hypothetical protein